ncbi:MAG: hypothetical protein JXR97_00530 [Planctomycetes bacterium]|nr:hypothetical protein [Planctomycetota bacterium]
MMNRKLSILLFAALFFSATLRGSDDLRILTRSLPNFAFDDDVLEFTIEIYRDEEPPKNARKRKKDRLEAEVTLSCGEVKETKKVSINYYADQPTAVSFDLDLSTLRDVPELFVTAVICKTGKTDAKAVRLHHVIKRADDIKVDFDHFMTTDGKRVLFLIPRPDDSVHRKWLPVKIINRMFQEKQHNFLLLGPSMNDNAYAGKLSELVGKNEQATLEIKLLAQKELQIYRMLLLALVCSDKQYEKVFIVPGYEDIHQGLPLDEYYMALQAVTAAFDSGPVPPRRIVLATPPVKNPGKRTMPYSNLVMRTATERDLFLSNLSTCILAESGKDVISLCPDTDEQNSMGARIELDGRRNGVMKIVLLPAAIFLIIGFSLFWLWSFSRYKKRKLS